MSLTAALVLAACSAAGTDKALNTARDQLGLIDAANLGRVMGRGSYGSAGVSGSRPTAFVAVQTNLAAPEAMRTIDARMQRNGFMPFGRCQPDLGCSWKRRVNHMLVRATAIVFIGGQSWGEKSTTHGTVAPGTRVLEVLMTVGG